LLPRACAARREAIMAINTAPAPAPATTLAAASSTPPRAARALGTAYRRNSDPGKPRPLQEVVKTWAFDSVGNRKYALQIKKASNGNPCLKIVEGVPQPDGTFRRFELTVWSEDWPRLFETIDGLRAFVAENNIRTPDGHKFDPNKPRKWSRGKRS
jgi:hypothetical protein